MRKTIDLQLFADAIRGKKIVYLYRLKKDAAKNAATALAFTTENGRTTSKDADTTETKDGTIRTPGAAEVEITATSILAKGDTLIDSLEDAMINDELVEIWEANLDEPASSGSNKFKGKIFPGLRNGAGKDFECRGYGRSIPYLWRKRNRRERRCDSDSRTAGSSGIRIYRYN